MKATDSRFFANHFGVYMAIFIVMSWLGLLIFNFSMEVELTNPLLYLGILLQTHFFTGLFITAHDAMHGTVSPNKRLNHSLGWITAGLFAFNYYPKLRQNHYKHHGWVAQAADPDYHDGPFLIWYYHFLKNYVSIWQILLMALTFNALNLFVPEPNLLLFWVVPSLLSTLQLFYFGTYIPHKQPEQHQNPHKSATQRKNHIWAFLSCYFFGYHYEHHEHPAVPWWLLYKVKGDRHL